MQIRYKRVRDVNPPSRGYSSDAGIDLYIPNDLNWESFTLQPGTDIRIPSGIKINIPFGWCATFLNKSGIAYNKKLIIGGQLIDSGYHGEIHLHLINVSNNEIILKRGQKVAQFIVLPVPQVEMLEVNGYNEESERGTKGFGSTDEND